MRRAPVVCAALLLLAPLPASAITLPPQFVAEDVAPGANFFLPVSANFLPDGRMLVCEKDGLLWLVKNGVKQQPALWSGANEVLSSDDRGLLDVAVDPNYFANHYIYLLYTVDPDSDGVDNNGDGFGRLTRYTIDFTDSSSLVVGSRTILMGTWWPDAPPELSPTHTIGTLRWGHDGSLLVGAGEGSQASLTDAGGNDPEAFTPGKVDPAEDIGAFRAQFLGSLAGKILRLNPETGHGYASNPYVDSDLASKRSRIWCYGLRNPFRFTMRPGTGVTDTSFGNPGVIYIGDVGWNTWEEMNICTQGGQNFGWPCFEGIYDQPNYQAASPSHNGCGTFGTPVNPAQARLPESAWNHSTGSVSTPPGIIGNTSVGGAFYQGTLYPGSYFGKYFYADFGLSWIKVATMNSSNQLLSVADFADAAEGPVCLITDPSNGDLIYVSIEAGQVRRIRYTGTSGGNTPPVAAADGTPLVGTVPLTVSFSSAGSYDPDNDPITYAWVFGDGFGSSQANPQHTYTTPGTFSVVLTVTDSAGAMGTANVSVVVNGGAATFPTTPVLDDFNRANGPVGGLWVDDFATLQVNANQLIQTSGAATTVWDGGVFGPDQEVYVTLQQITPSSSEHDLMLKVQGTSWSAGHIEVRYNATPGNVVVTTYQPSGGWIQRGVITVTYTPGDRFGARANANGTVEVYRNSTQIGTASTSGWPFNGAGGRLGLTLGGATSSRLDNFGGGTKMVNTAPNGAVLTPPDSTFYFAGDSVKMTASATDAQDLPDSLHFRWEVDLHHNNHVHPDVQVADSSACTIVGQDYDDGTGVWLLVRMIVRDTGGLRDTVVTQLFPEVDLTPSAVLTNPGNPGTANPTAYQFKLRNLGRLQAPLTRWRLVADQATIAEGDTTVPALDSVTVTRVLPPTLTAGTHVLRLVADTLGKVVETVEGNNAVTRPLTVVSGTGTLDVTPVTEFAISEARPNPSTGSVAFALRLPREARVAFEVVDVQGRRVWHEAERRLEPGEVTLAWRRGAAAEPGLYFARVTVDGRATVRRFAILR